MSQNFSPKNGPKFLCYDCDYKCCKKSDFDKHLSTVKHKNATNASKMLVNASKKVADENHNNNEYKFICKCGKKYIHDSSFYRHKKLCKIIDNIDITVSSNNQSSNKESSDKELMMLLIKENSEFKSMMLKVLENGLYNNCNNSNNINNINNSNNKTFNLNVFLNETCKNAMNISDFMNSIQLQLSDLESVGELGYINGISNIIIQNLKKLDITERPIHCTDAKRETLYIKDQDKWKKEGEQKEIIVKFVSNVANKNIRMLSEFKKKYPDCCKYESKYSDYYSKLIIEAMGGSGGTDAEKHEKIVKKICKELTIDKSIL
jgi:hypothetical protein